MEVSLWHTALFAVDSLGREWGGRHWKKELGTVYPFKEGKRNVPVYLYKIFNELHDKHAHTHTRKHLRKTRNVYRSSSKCQLTLLGDGDTSVN